MKVTLPPLSTPQMEFEGFPQGFHPLWFGLSPKKVFFLNPRSHFAHLRPHPPPQPLKLCSTKKTRKSNLVSKYIYARNCTKYAIGTKSKSIHSIWRTIYRDSTFTGTHIYIIDLFEDKDDKNLFWKNTFSKRFFPSRQSWTRSTQNLTNIFAHVFLHVINALNTWMCELLSWDAWRVFETWSSPCRAGPKVRIPFLPLFFGSSASQPPHLRPRPDHQRCFRWICGPHPLLPDTWGKIELRWEIFEDWEKFAGQMYPESLLLQRAPASSPPSPPGFLLSRPPPPAPSSPPLPPSPPSSPLFFANFSPPEPDSPSSTSHSDSLCLEVTKVSFAQTNSDLSMIFSHFWLLKYFCHLPTFDFSMNFFTCALLSDQRQSFSAAHNFAPTQPEIFVSLSQSCFGYLSKIILRPLNLRSLFVCLLHHFFWT